MVQNGIYASHQLPPHPYFKDSAVVGVAKLNVEAEKIKYVCQKRTSLLDNNNDGMAVSSHRVRDVDSSGDSNNNNNNTTQFSYVSPYTFYSNGCTKTAQTKNTSVCISCAKKKGVFKRRLLHEVDLREGPLDPKMPNGRLMFLPYLMLEKVKYQKKVIQVISTKKKNEKRRLEKKVEFFKTRLKFHVNHKEALEKVFRDKTDQLAAAFSKEKGVGKNI